MVNKETTSNPLHYWFILFVFIHLVLWTLAPTLVRFNLPMDSIEGAIWGHQLEWGYDKNPFLNGWLTALATYLGGTSGWTVYLFSQLCVVSGFWAVWQLAKKMLPPCLALLAVLLLEGIQYYNFHAIDFNDNTLEVGLWPLTIWFFYRALTEQKKLIPWLLTGCFAGLGMMAKYYTGLLLLPMLLFLLYSPSHRAQFKSMPIYAGLLLFMMITLPHVIWLTQHDFLTLHYAIDRVASPPTWSSHVFYPLQFIWQQGEAMLPALLLLSFMLIGKKSAQDTYPVRISHLDKSFLWFVGVGPFLLTVLLSAVMGMKLRAGWGQPLFSLWGIIAILLCKPSINEQKLKRFMLMLFGLMGLSVAGYATALISAPKPSSANFPGEQIAQKLTRTWQDKFHKPLEYVAGTRWIAGNIAFYSPAKPAVYIEWSRLLSPWINEDKLRSAGAIFVWDMSDGKTAKPEAIKARFSQLTPIEVEHYAWMRNKKMPPVEIWVAYLPPQ